MPLIERKEIKCREGGMIHECQSNVADTCCLYTRLEIAIHSMKSVLEPVESLGFSRFLF